MSALTEGRKRAESLTSISIEDSEAKGQVYALRICEWEQGKFGLSLSKQTSPSDLPVYSSIEIVGTDDGLTYRISVRNGNLVKSLV